MLSALLILSFVLVHMYDDFGPFEDASSEPPHVVIIRFCLVLFGAWLVSHIKFMRAARLMDRGDSAAPLRAESVLQTSRVLAVIMFGVSIYGYGLLDAVRAYVGEPVLLDRVLCALPLWVMIAAGWYSKYPVERRMREALLMREIHGGKSVEPLPDRASYVSLQVRHQMLMWILPMCMISGAGDGVARIIESNESWSRALGGVGSHIVQFIASFSMFVLAPFVIVRLWKTIELGGGELRERIRSVVHQHGVRVQGPYVWRTGAGVLNAAVLGVLYPMRYLLYTESLLETLTPRELEAVSAHEVAHLKRHHMPWLAVVAFAAAGVGGVAVELFERAHDAWYSSSPLISAEMWTHASTIGVLLWVALIFTYASRCFERQADAFAARHLSEHGPDRAQRVTSEAASSVSQALVSVAYHNGMHEDKFQWRHGSIADRRRRIHALVGVEIDRMPIDRTCAILRWTSVIVVMCMVVLALFGV